MLPTHHNALVAILAEIDQIIAGAESHVAKPDDPGNIETAEAVLQDMQRARVAAEGHLRVENNS